MLITGGLFALMLYALLKILGIWHAGQVRMLDGTVLSLKSKPGRFIAAMTVVTATCLLVLGYTGFEILDTLTVSWSGHAPVVD